MAARNFADATFPCPHCGSPVPSSAMRCRECGASEDCGWNEDFQDDYEASDDDFDYDQFVAREFPEDADRPASTGHKPWVKAVVLLLILTFLVTLWAF